MTINRIVRDSITEALVMAHAGTYVRDADGIKELSVSPEQITRIVNDAREYEKQRLIAFNIRAVFGHYCETPSIAEVIEKENLRRASNE